MVVCHGLTIIQRYPVIGLRFRYLADYLIFRAALVYFTEFAVLAEAVQLSFCRAAQRQDLLAEFTDIRHAAIIDIHRAKIRAAVFISDRIKLLVCIVICHIADLTIQITDLALCPDLALRCIDAQLLEGIDRDHVTIDIFRRIDPVYRCNILCIRSVLLIGLHHAGLKVCRIAHVEAVDLVLVQCGRLLEAIGGKPQIHIVIRLVHGIVHNDHHEIIPVIAYVEFHVFDRLAGFVLIHRKPSVFAGSVGTLEDDRCNVLVILKGCLEDRLVSLLFSRRFPGKFGTFIVYGNRIFQRLYLILIVQCRLHLQSRLGVIRQHVFTGTIAAVPKLR